MCVYAEREPSMHLISEMQETNKKRKKKLFFLPTQKVGR